MPFPIQRVQIDPGREFTAYQVQDLLWEWGIKYRPTRPRSPHLNGKVERVQQTVLHEFYPTVDLNDETLELQLEEWQFYYNWHRVHGAIGETPMGKVNRLLTITPFWEEVSASFEPQAERLGMHSFGPGSC
jgi:transposase InsO family protein